MDRNNNNELSINNGVSGTLGILAFIIATILLKVIPEISSNIKFIVFLVLLLLNIRKKEYYLLLFPIAVFESVWGTLIAGRVGALTIYLGILFLKFVFSSKLYLKKKMDLIILLILSAYCLSAFVIVGDSEWIRIALFAFATVILMHEELVDLKDIILVVWYTGIAVAISFCFALNGYEAFTEGAIKGYRAKGLGFSDPNYSSYICCLALCSSLNLPDIKWKNILSIVTSMILFIGVFRSGSRSGLICLALCFLLKVVITKGLQKKYTYIAVGILAIILAYLYILPKMDYSDVVLGRLETVLNFTHSTKEIDVTNGRSYLATSYINYYFNQNPIRMLSGFNILQSNTLYQKVGVSAACHNLFIDSILAFGLLGFIFLFGVYIKRTIELFKRRMGSDDAIFMMKCITLLFGMTVSFVYRIPFWFVYFL